MERCLVEKSESFKMLLVIKLVIIILLKNLNIVVFIAFLNCPRNIAASYCLKIYEILVILNLCDQYMFLCVFDLFQQCQLSTRVIKRHLTCIISFCIYSICGLEPAAIFKKMRSQMFILLD